MSEHILSVRDLTKRVSKNKAIVDGVSFDMRKGEILGLLGPNGAGKTTTIRMIVGLIKKSGGSVTINGKDIDKEAQATRADIGAIVENPAFYEYMSGYKNLKLSARMAKASEARIDEVIKLVQLEKAIKDKVSKYSLGMKQRLGVAQAMLHKPALLILDEPTNGLDPKGIRELRDYLRELANEGISTLVSSHLLSEMQLMCDRVVIMEKGKVIDISELATLNAYKEEGNEIVSLLVKKGQGQLAKDLLEEVEDVRLVSQEKEHELIFEMPRRLIPMVNKQLVGAEVDVFGIESKRTSLEEKFLALTAEQKGEV
ncbi:ABC transporter ATP-binding protein [Alteribacter aurantiacus]|uniref:ABC transporter ATP-binding protein n=1 Tax=Alteribacter aurantiacus TaxID=254410 RepID=UPI00040F1314|nr:ABC transporter ATP-binding protein [Alteribacter aurantiacus]